jgi:hypothetical protein
MYGDFGFIFLKPGYDTVDMQTIASSLPTVAQCLDGEKGENPRFPKSLLHQSGCYIVS